MDNLTATWISRKTKSKEHCIRKGLEMMMDSMLHVSVEQARITLRLAGKFPAEDKSKELGIRD